MDELITNGSIFELPYQLGSMSISKKVSRKGKQIDFHKTKLYGMTIYFNNNHSGQYYAFFKWNKRGNKCKVGHKPIYKFVATRCRKRELAKAIKDKNSINLYIEEL